MKVLLLVALFAFVAVQVCQSAPVPDDEKPEAEKKDAPAPAAPVAEPAPPAPAPVEKKAEPVNDAAAAKPTEAPAAEEKKE